MLLAGASFVCTLWPFCAKMRHIEKSDATFLYVSCNFFQNGADFFQKVNEIFQNGVDYFSWGAVFLGKSRVEGELVAPVAFPVARTVGEYAPVKGEISGG